jgi:site-specific recombinase XerC
MKAQNQAVTSLLSDRDTFLLLEKVDDRAAKIILSLLLKTGMTVSELAALTVDHLALDRNELTLSGKRRRTLLLDHDLSMLLREHLASHHLPRTRHLLFTRESRQMSERRIQQIVAESTRRVLGTALNPRYLRTSYIINELKKGTPIATIEERTGLATLQSYVYIYLSAKQA